MQGAQGGKAGWPWRRCPLAWDFRELEGRDLRGRRRSLRRLSGQERALTDSSEAQVAQHLTLRKGAGLDIATRCSARLPPPLPGRIPALPRPQLQPHCLPPVPQLPWPAPSGTPFLV